MMTKNEGRGTIRKGMGMRFQLFILTLILAGLCLVPLPGCKHSTEPPPSGPMLDTTSHNYVWTSYTFGGPWGSSGFKDVAILNDTTAWAVGEVFDTDATGKPDYRANAVAKWDGTGWNLQHLFYVADDVVSGPDTLLISAIRDILPTGENDFRLAAGGIFRWNGISSLTQLEFSRFNLPDPNATIETVCKTSSGTIYGAGDDGTIVRYSGGSWSGMEGGSTIILKDIWAIDDGSQVWACGFSIDESQSILMKYNGTSWNTVWYKAGNYPVPPFQYFATSVWGDQSVYVAGGRSVFRIQSTPSDTSVVATLPWFPYRIRGTAENNIAVVGDEGMIWHYNGSTWKQLNLHSGQPLYGLAVSKNLIVAVGEDTNIGLGAALIYVGRKQ